MTGLKSLGAAAILSGALAASAAAQEAVQEPGALGQNHPFADYLTGGYGVHGTYRDRTQRLCLLQRWLRAGHLVCRCGRAATLLSVIAASQPKGGPRRPPSSYLHRLERSLSGRYALLRCQKLR